MSKGAFLPDIKTIIEAGIDPKTGFPDKIVVGGCRFLEGMAKLLTVIDRQDAINRYKWFNLPDGLTGDLIERVLYFRGQGIFFHTKEDDKFMFLPFCLSGDIDEYGRYKKVSPVLFNGADDGEKPWIQGFTRDPLYEVFTDLVTPDDIDKYCVILKDYTNGIAQTVIPRSILQKPIIDAEAELFPYMRTMLKNACGTAAFRVSNADEGVNVDQVNAAIDQAVISGQRYVAAVGNVPFQELTAGQITKASEYLLAMQSLDNFRLSCLGIENGGLFEKKAHITNAEQAVNGSNIGLVAQDGLTRRQEFCDIVNSLTGLGISCEISETIAEYDINADGLIQDESDQSGTAEGTQKPTPATEEE